MTGKLAPMLSGFINVGMGWKWTLVSHVLLRPPPPSLPHLTNACLPKWWCSIFNGIALVYCFLFMEETNYDRPARSVENSTFTGHATGVQEQHNGSDADEKSSDKAGEKNMTNAKPVDSETGQVIYPRKTYIQKLGIKDKTRPNRMLDIALGGLRGFTYPSVVYAGWEPFFIS